MYASECLMSSFAVLFCVTVLCAAYSCAVCCVCRVLCAACVVCCVLRVSCAVCCVCRVLRVSCAVCCVPFRVFTPRPRQMDQMSAGSGADQKEWASRVAAVEQQLRERNAAMQSAVEDFKAETARWIAVEKVRTERS